MHRLIILFWFIYVQILNMDSKMLLSSLKQMHFDYLKPNQEVSQSLPTLSEDKQKIVDELYVLVKCYGYEFPKLNTTECTHHILNRARKLLKSHGPNYNKVHSLIVKYDGVQNPVHNVDKLQLLNKMAKLVKLEQSQNLENNFEQDVLHTVKEYISTEKESNNMKELKRLIGKIKHPKVYKKSNFRKSTKSEKKREDKKKSQNLARAAVLLGSFKMDEINQLLQNRNPKSTSFKKIKKVILEKSQQVVNKSD